MDSWNPNTYVSHLTILSSPPYSLQSSLQLFFLQSNLQLFFSMNFSHVHSLRENVTYLGLLISTTQYLIWSNHFIHFIWFIEDARFKFFNLTLDLSKFTYPVCNFQHYQEERELEYPSKGEFCVPQHRILLHKDITHMLDSVLPVSLEVLFSIKKKKHFHFKHFINTIQPHCM